MPLALVFTDKDCAGLEAPVKFIELPTACQATEKLDRLAIESAKRLFLDPVGDHASHDILRQARRWVRSEHRPPALAKRVEAEGPDLVDLDLDRSGVYGPLVHG